MKRYLYSIVAVAVLVLGLSRQPVLAQPGPPDFANMDPQQMQAMMQKMILSNLRDQLAVTNDAEWGVLEGRLTKVMKLRMEVVMSSMAGGLRSGNMGPMAARFAEMYPLGPEAAALDKAVKNSASSAEIKSALAKMLEARKRKQAELDSAQSDLRQLLTLRQESRLVLDGLLD